MKSLSLVAGRTVNGPYMNKCCLYFDGAHLACLVEIYWKLKVFTSKFELQVGGLLILFDTK